MPRAWLKRRCAFYINCEKEDTEVALLAGDLTGGSDFRGRLQAEDQLIRS